MVNLNLILASVLAPILVATSVDATFAICAGARHNAQNQITMGFHLWDKNFKQSAAHSTVRYSHLFTSVTLEDNGWKVTPTVHLSNVAGSPAGSMSTLKVSHAELQVSKTFAGLESVCGYLEGDRFRGLFFGCYDNGDPGWCNKYEKYYKSQCGTGLYMGPDSVYCNSAKRA